jgi:ankyrin repeat protein
MRVRGRWLGVAVPLLVLGAPPAGLPQVPPASSELTGYTGLHAAAARGDVAEIRRLIAQGADPAARDGHGRTPLLVAAFGARTDAMRALVDGGADPNALDIQRYDVVTIAAVRGDVATLRQALALGASPRNVTSPYDGTALIAAAHLGHADVVRLLVEAGARSTTSTTSAGRHSSRP